MPHANERRALSAAKRAVSSALAAINDTLQMDRRAMH